jgi:hypothetical protein
VGITEDIVPHPAFDSYTEVVDNRLIHVGIGGRCRDTLTPLGESPLQP